MKIHYYLTLFITVVSLIAVMYFIERFRKNRDVFYRKPFESRPRPAGHSLQLRTDDLWHDVMENVFFMIIVAVSPLFALGNFWAAWSLTILSLIAIVVFARKIYKLAKSYEMHKLGLKGEQLVGVTLDRLSTKDLKVFHDYPVHEKGKKPWNIDHILVAPTGVYAIETKTRSKTRDVKGHEVIYENDQLYFPSFIDRHGLEQSKRQAQYLSNELTGSIGSQISAIPVLVLPGWMVERRSNGISVLSTKELNYFFTGKETIDEKTRQQVCHQLEKACEIE